MASKLYGVNATIIIFVFVLYCVSKEQAQSSVEGFIVGLENKIKFYYYYYYFISAPVT